MGSRNSKEPKVEVLEPGKVGLTPEVLHRLQVFQAKNLQVQKQLDVDVVREGGDNKIEQVVATTTTTASKPATASLQSAVEVEKVKGGTSGGGVDHVDDMGGSGDGVGRTVELNEKVPVVDNFKSDSSISQSETKENFSAAENENKDPVYYDGMDKLSNYFLQDKSQKLRGESDLEGGDEVLAHDLDRETSFSYFLSEPRQPMRSPKYEVVDETRLGARKEDMLLDEEAMIEGPPPSPRFKGVRVSRAILPIVIDHDPEGNTTVETLTAWKMKARMEKEIFKYNQHWQQELEKITAKMENETKAHATEFDTRLEQFKVKNPEEAAPFKGTICKGIPPQIGKCYEKNQSQLLKCNGLVQEFAKCTNVAGGGSA